MKEVKQISFLRALGLFLTFLLLTAFFGCSSVKTYSDFDPNSKFSSYKTFEWLSAAEKYKNHSEPLQSIPLEKKTHSEKKAHSKDDSDIDLQTTRRTVIDSPLENPLVDKRIRIAVENEMAQKGFLHRNNGETPDFWISYHGSTREKISSSGNTNISPGIGFGFGYGYGYGFWPGYYGASMATGISQYTEGTLILDLIDAKTNQLFWRGIATKTLDKPVVSQETITEVIHKMLGAYPPSDQKSSNQK